MLLVVLAQQILAVVVAVRRPHDRVDVNAAGHFRPGQRDRRLMIELDQDHRAVDPVVEDGIAPRGADPGEVRGVEVLPHFLHADACAWPSDMLPTYSAMRSTSSFFCAASQVEATRPA